MNDVQNDNLGIVKISDDVLIVCAIKATLKIKGVSGLSGGLTDNLSRNILGKEPLSKGIRITRSDDGITFDIFLIVDYKVKIPQLAWDIQISVKNEIEEITDLKVQAVNIHIQGVKVPEEDNKTDD